MIDGLYKARMDRVWDRMAHGLVRMGLTPNQVTVLGLILVLTSCAQYLVFQSSFWFGFLLALSLAGDALDGAVARLTRSSSRFGGYLDAVIDRYQEIAIFCSIAVVRDWWPLCFVAVTGSMLVSYNKARVAIEVPIDNFAWPDLLERTERVILLVSALLFDGLLPRWNILWWGISAIALLSHLTAIQRFLRARRLLLGTPRAGDD